MIKSAAVALTSTINTEFGSKLVSPSTGIVLNNEMDDFSSPGEVNHYGLAPHEANFIARGEAALSSMSPTIVTRDGKLYAVAGASGGPRIITATAQLLLNVIARGMSPLDAVNAPRLHHQLVPRRVQKIRGVWAQAQKGSFLNLTWKRCGPGGTRWSTPTRRRRRRSLWW